MKNIKFRKLTAKELEIRQKHPNAHLVVPSIRFIKSYITAIEEGFFDYKDINSEFLKNDIQAKKFIKQINSGISWDTPTIDKKNPCHVFWLMENGVFLGRVRLKNLLTPFNSPVWNNVNTFRGGHIGYSVAPKHRGRGLSVLQLSLAIDKVQELAPQLLTIFHSVDILNIASTKTSLACGYSLHGSFKTEETKNQVFVLPLNFNKIDIPNYSENS